MTSPKLTDGGGWVCGQSPLGLHKGEVTFPLQEEGDMQGGRGGGLVNGGAGVSGDASTGEDVAPAVTEATEAVETGEVLPVDVRRLLESFAHSALRQDLV